MLSYTASFLILLAVLAFTAQTFCFKVFNSNYMKNMASYFAFNFISSLLISIMFFIIAGKNQSYHTYTILTGVSFGIMYILTVYFYTKAMEVGPLSLTTLLYMSSILVPVLAGTIFWKETISAVQIVGLILMLVMFYIMVNSGQSGESNISVKWIVYSLLSFVCNGCLGVLLKYHQRLSPQKEIFEFMTVAFAASALVSIPLFLLYNKGKKESISHLKNMKFLAIAAVTAITAGGGNGIDLSLAGVIPGIILFPVISGGVIILSTVVSLMVFKEDITKKGIVGFGIGLVSVILLSLK